MKFKHSFSVACIILLCCVFACNMGGNVKQLSEKEFELKPFKYRLVHSDDLNKDAIKLTTDGSVWVDRAKLF